MVSNVCPSFFSGRPYRPSPRFPLLCWWELTLRGGLAAGRGRAQALWDWRLDGLRKWQVLMSVCSREGGVGDCVHDKPGLKKVVGLAGRRQVSSWDSAQMAAAKMFALHPHCHPRRSFLWNSLVPPNRSKCHVEMRLSAVSIWKHGGAIKRKRKIHQGITAVAILRKISGYQKYFKVEYLF